MKKLLAMMIAAMLVLALVPMTAMAATEVTDQTSLQNALNNGGDIVVANDIVLTSAVSVPTGKTVVLDLNGNTISLEDSSSAACYMIKNSGNLTIKDSSAAGTGKITFTSTTPDSSHKYSTSTIGVGGAGGTLVVESGTIENNTVGGASYAIDNFWYTDDISVTINGGTITGKGIAVRQVPFSTTAENVLNINGGTISGGTAAVQTFNYQAAACPAEVNISGGSLSGTYAYYTYYTDDEGHAGTDIEITGGELDGYVYIANTVPGSSDAQFENLSISGGTFTGNAGMWIFTIDANNNYDYIPAISGGSYDVEPWEGMIEDDALVINTNEGETPYVIGDDAEEALASAPAGSTVEIISAPRDAELTVAFEVTVVNGTQNSIKVNGVEVGSEDTIKFITPVEEAPIPETGDGMGLFVFAGLALISMLGMVVLKKREQF